MTSATTQPTFPTPEPDAKPGQIDKPGIYDLPEDVYHDDPVAGGSLSCSSAKLLLRPSCPAKYRYAMDHPRPPKRVFDFGHAAHKLVLGRGSELVVIDADNYKTKAAQEAQAAAYAAGKIPVLVGELAQVKAMAKAIRSHPIASALLHPDSGSAEQSIVWFDQVTKVWCRSRLDFLRHPTPGRRLIIPDYKTTASANPDDIQKSISNFGYHQQAAWYMEAVKAVGYASNVAFVFIFQEKTAPYVVTVAECDPFALHVGAYLNREARYLYRKCTDTGHWPGYSEDVELIALPPWVERQYDGVEL